MIPPLPDGCVGLLATLDASGPAVVPVSALHRTSPRRLLFALAPHRGSLARLRGDPRTALALLGPGMALTVHGRSAVVADPLPGAPFVVALALEADRVTDTAGARTLVLDGVRWAWRDAASAGRHVQVLAALAAHAAAA